MNMGATANLRALANINPEDADSGIEFAVVFTSGRIFYTGGFESPESLKVTLREEREIAGSYNPGKFPWNPTYINGGKIESVIDLRVDTADED